MSEIETLQRQMDSLILFARAFGFDYIPYGNNTTRFCHYKSKSCLCGDQRYPVIEPYIYEPGKWIARCPHCDARSIESNDPVDAVRNWNRRNLTEASLIASQELTKDNIDVDGCQELLKALKQSAVDDLAAAEKAGKLDSHRATQAEWFLKNRKIINYVKSGEYRERLEEERKKYEDLHREGPCDGCPDKSGECPENDQDDPAEAPGGDYGLPEE